MRDRLIHRTLAVGFVCSHMARMCAARRLTAVMLGQMECLVGSGDLDGCDLSSKGLDLRGVWMFQLLRVCFVTLVLAQLLPAFSGFLLVFLRLCIWLRLIFWACSAALFLVAS